MNKDADFLPFNSILYVIERSQRWRPGLTADQPL